MPLYEYVCRGCDEKFEKYVRAWGEAVSCPRCRGEDVEKQLSRFAFGGTGGFVASAGGGCGCGRGGCGCGH
jgi:putative FmdB family regulatory protein